MEIEILVNNKIYCIGDKPIINFENFRNNEPIIVFNHINVCYINCFAEKKEGKYYSGQYVIDIKNLYNIKISNAINLIINCNKSLCDLFLIENAGMDFNDIKLVSEMVELYFNKGIRIYFFIFPNEDIDFKILPHTILKNND